MCFMTLSVALSAVRRGSKKLTSFFGCKRSKKMNNSEFLGKEKMGKLIFKFAVPCILSLLISALYNIVDQIFIGNSDAGAIGNTATTIVFPLTNIALALVPLTICLPLT